MVTAKKTSPFSQTFLDQIKTLLLEEQKRVERELTKFARKDPHAADTFAASFPEYGDEEDDNAREVAEYTTNKPLELSLEKTLRDVSKALERIGAGTYGICKYCGKPIDEKRLLARPTSSACVSCKKTITDEA